MRNLLLAGAMLALATPAAALGPLYNFTDLGAAGQNSYATDVNASGVVSGGTLDAAGDPDKGLIASVDASGVHRTLVAAPGGALGLRFTGINDFGVAVGTTQSESTLHYAGALYSPQANIFLSIPTISGLFPYSDVLTGGINDSYQVTGYMIQNVGQNRYIDAYLYDPSFGSLRLARIGGDRAIGVGINGYGAVVGYGNIGQSGGNTGGPDHGLIYYPGIGTFDVSTNPTARVGFGFYLNNVNNHNVAVGYTTGSCTSCIQPLVYDNGTTVIVNTSGVYVDINDTGLIVGETGGLNSDAFLVDGSGRYKLSDLIVGANFGPNIHLGNVSAVNASGAIVGTADVYNGVNTEQHAYILTPFDAAHGCLSCGGGGGGGMPPGVPEPATWTMMIIGLGLAGGALRRRRQSPAVSFR